MSDAAVCYSGVDDAISMIKTWGKVVFLQKQISKMHFVCFGNFWQGKFFCDRAMPMECASSCRTFETFAPHRNGLPSNI